MGWGGSRKGAGRPKGVKNGSRRVGPRKRIPWFLRELAEGAARLYPPAPTACWLYFIWAPEAERIKIGRTRDVANRLRDLSTGSPVPLRLLGAVPCPSKTEEFRVHMLWMDHWSHGEWFRRSPELWDWIVNCVIEESILPR